MILSESAWHSPPGPPEWPGGEVHVWRTALNLPARLLAGLERILAADEQERVRRFRFEGDRRRYLVGRGLLRVLLGRYLEIAPARVRFDYTRFGKPHLAAGLAPRLLQFNVSHSGEQLLIAVADGRALGVDVEQIRPDIGVDAIAGRFFSSNEQAALAGLAGCARIEAFFDCWTRKEAYIKAKGEGLSLPLDQFDVALMPGEAARLIETRPDPAEARRWRLASLDVADGYRAALAVEGDGWTLRCWDWSPEGEPWQT
jgi:4'-phosphopantetheinyl transferase